MSRTLPVLFMYSGQGSQYYGMAKDLYDNNSVFRAALQNYDEVVAQASGRSVLERIYDPSKPRNHPFSDTALAHPAIVMIELALTDALAAEGIFPDAVLGSSLGEYTASVVSGSIDRYDCLRLLVKQVEALSTCPRGGMLVVLAAEGSVSQLPELDACELAAHNYPGSFVVAGSESNIALAESALRANGVLSARLPVEYGFHSSAMRNLVEGQWLPFADIEIAVPQVPWISCVDGKSVPKATWEHFRNVTRQPIEFQSAIAEMQKQQPFLYLDLGPAGTLHNFVRNVLPDAARSQSMPLLSQFGKDTDKFGDVVRRLAPQPTEQRPKTTELKVYGFPGQGSQRKGMGKGLFERFPAETAAADEVLGYSIETLCLVDPDRRLGRTEFIQPALFVVSALTFLDRVSVDPVPPDFVVGHSLGEYVALYAAGVFDFETGLRLVQRRGQLMGAVEKGAMAAIVDLAEDQVLGVLADGQHRAVDLANQNAPDQWVVSGPSREIDAVSRVFESMGGRTVRLRIDAALHSRYMRSVAEEFRHYLEDFTFSPPRVAVFDSADASLYEADTVGSRLVRQIASSVRWTDTVHALMSHGDFEFVELGPGRVLSKLVARIRSQNEAGDFETASGASRNAVSPRSHFAGVGSATPRTRTWDSSEVSYLGAGSFRERYGLRLAYGIGSMYGGISGTDLVKASVDAGLLAVLGAGGLPLPEVDRRLCELIGVEAAYGVNVLHRPGEPGNEDKLVDLLMSRGVSLIEASGFPHITDGLVRFRLKGGRILAKVSRSDTAAVFFAPAPRRIVDRLLHSGAVTPSEVEERAWLPMADDICVEANGGWLNSTADLLTLLPSILELRDQSAISGHKVHVGCAGGIGTPEATAAAFFLGADFVLTGSVNQCSLEAATSDHVKDLLQHAREHDVETAPSAIHSEDGMRATYLKRGLLFPSRAQKLYDLWQRQEALVGFDDESFGKICDRFMRGEWSPLSSGHNSKDQLAELFRRYVERGFRLASTGDESSKIDYLVYCGPALGAFNRSVAGTEMTEWRNRKIGRIADHLMDGAVEVAKRRQQGGREAEESRINAR